MLSDIKLILGSPVSSGRLVSLGSVGMLGFQVCLAVLACADFLGSFCFLDVQGFLALCYAMFCFAMLCLFALCYAIFCSDMLVYVLFCYVVLVLFIVTGAGMTCPFFFGGGFSWL